MRTRTRRPQDVPHGRSSRRIISRGALATLVIAGGIGAAASVPAAATPNATTCSALTAAGNANTKRAYNNASLINTPVSCLADATDTTKWATRWYEYGFKGVWTNPTQWAAYKGDIDLNFRYYSSPIYDGKGLSTRRIFGSKNWYNADRPTTGAGAYEVVPWSTSWTTSTGHDGEITVIDSSTGKEWGFWQPLDPNYWFNGCMFSYPDFHPEWGDLCFAGIRHGTNYVSQSTADLAAPYSDYRHNSASDGFSQGALRGMGAINSVAMIPTFDEVKYAIDQLKLGNLNNGYIHHALNMETYNTMFGNPVCTLAQFGTSAEGSSCGYSVAPATRVEYAAHDNPEFANTAANREKTVPLGTRFYLKQTDAQIQSWLAGRGMTTANPKYWVAYVFARTLREYGWIVSDTTNWTSTISVDGSTNPTKVAQWASLGIDVLAAPSGAPNNEVDGPDLLTGLVTGAGQVGVVKIPDSSRCITDPAYPAAKNKCVGI